MNTGLEGTSLILLDNILGEIEGEFLGAAIGLAVFTLLNIGAPFLLAAAATIPSATVIPVVAAVVGRHCRVDWTSLSLPDPCPAIINRQRIDPVQW